MDAGGSGGGGKPEDIFERFFSFALSWVYIGRSGEGGEGEGKGSLHLS